VCPGYRGGARRGRRPDQSDYLLPHRDAAWALLEERVREAASFCGLVRKLAPDHVADQLATVGEALTGVADSLAAHFGEWGAVSRSGAEPLSQKPTSK
jgi:hypothetical protein